MTKKILVVDDQGGIMKDYLDSMGFNEENGYEVEIAKDSKTAIEKVRKNSYLFVTMDGHLGFGDLIGSKVVEEIRKFNKTIPIIMLSGNENMNKAGVECGANASMDKADFFGGDAGEEFREILKRIGVKI